MDMSQGTDKTLQGIVKWFNEEKGFGFIAVEGKNDFFVHKNDIVDGPIREGDKVTFEVGEGKKGPCAINVKLDREIAE